MPAQRSPRSSAGHVERRGWLSGSLGGLAVSVLGLSLAGSLASTTSAQPLIPPATALTAPAQGGTATGRVGPVPGRTPSTDPSVTAPYRSGQGAGPTRAVREALVAERAAQRAEELAKDADEVSRAARTASGKKRQQELTDESRATRTKGKQLAKEALERAVAARVAAEQARLAAEATQQAEAARQPASAAAPDRRTATAEAAAPAGPPAPPAAPVVAAGSGVSPVPGAVVGAGFGEYGLWSRYHTGLDFRAGYGVPIRAVKSGTVRYAGNSGSWSGNHVAVQHADGMTTMSSHMSSIRVQAGQTVSAGEVLGYVGSTGRAFGAHLHFELYPAGVRYGDIYRAVNPVPWLRAAGVITR